MALRALFQADVGRQPMRQVLTGALEQLAAGVRSGLIMASKQAERELAADADPPNVVPSVALARERRRIRGHVSRQLARCVTALDALIAQTVSIRPSRTPNEALETFPDAVRPAVEHIERVLTASTLPGHERQRADAVFRAALDGMKRTLAKRLPAARQTADLLTALAVGAWTIRAETDERLRPLTEEWPLERQSAVDRNILRLATFELLHCPETPPAVVMNEAVELAKRYGSDESSRFVNGVLAALAAAAGLVPAGGAK